MWRGADKSVALDTFWFQRSRRERSVCVCVYVCLCIGGGLRGELNEQKSMKDGERGSEKARKKIGEVA